MIELTPLFGGIVAIGVLIVGGLVSWGVAKATLLFLSDRVKEIDSNVDRIASKVDKASDRIQAYLFASDGQTIYMPRGACDRLQHECQDRFCLVVTGLKKENNEAHERIYGMIDRNRETVSVQYETILTFMGEVRQFMKAGDKS